MTKTKVQKATEYAHNLDEVTQATLDRVKSKNNKAIVWFIVSWTILFAVGVVGIYYNIHESSIYNQKIDCIFKDLKVPTTGNQHKYIASIASQCTIKVTQ